MGRTKHIFNSLNRRDFIRLAGLVGAGTASGLLWGCTAPEAATTGGQPSVEVTESQGPSGPQGELVIVQGVDAESLDPYVTTSGASKGMVWSIYDKLLERSPDMQLIPWLATEWQVVDDTTWEFKLRDEVYFHNGEKFSAEHVRDSITRFKDPNLKNVYAAQLAPVVEVEVVDPLTVRIKTDGPFALLAEVLSTYCEILPKAITSGEVDAATQAIGTGPYRFVEWTPGDRMVVEAATLAGGQPHFSGQPRLQRILWRPVPEGTTRVVELKTGQAHLITPVDPVQRQELEADPATGVIAFRQINSIIVVLNSLKVEPFQDVRVRQALNYATDVPTLINTVMQGAAYQLAGPFGPGIPGYDPELEPYPYDPDKARQLLAEAGYGDGFELTLVSPNGRYLNDRLASEAIAGMWSEVGVQTTVQVMDWSPFVEGVLGKTHDAFFFSQVGVLLDATVSINFHSGRKGAAWQGYDNPEVNQIIDEAPKEMDAEKRNEMYKRLGRIIYEECPWVFLWNQQGLFGIRNEVQGWEPHQDGIIRLGDIHLAA
ncbi:ABC transporter substrate-binding protein [Litorilinea aerophila]|uniref:Solute-binding protein family 5 domain-containing protein n=1 Tax=Litorilinea aerophila TaxID=1204385 RepID=A0A540VI36_9CHLR|nr:ABC transporter substrate-binding protein [Litorilinea aerophila]MCC9076075.1 ABC transporter substrate-binding protein [Litorilinea aerophila]